MFVCFLMFAFFIIVIIRGSSWSSCDRFSCYFISLFLFYFISRETKRSAQHISRSDTKHVGGAIISTFTLLLISRERVESILSLWLSWQNSHQTVNHNSAANICQCEQPNLNLYSRVGIDRLRGRDCKISQPNCPQGGAATWTSNKAACHCI